MTSNYRATRAEREDGIRRPALVPTWSLLWLFSSIHREIAGLEVPVVARAHDAFLFPSWHREATSMALLGAMSCGLAVISTTAGGTGEVVRDRVNALVVPADDTTALSQAVEALLDEAGLARRLGLAAREPSARASTWRG